MKRVIRGSTAMNSNGYRSSNLSNLPTNWEKDPNTSDRYIYWDDRFFASAYISNSFDGPKQVSTLIQIVDKLDPSKSKSISKNVIVSNVEKDWESVLFDTVCRADELLKNIKSPESDVILSAINWNDLNGTEQSAAECAIYEIQNNNMSVEDAVSYGCNMYSSGNAEPEYEDEDFYEEEANYNKVFKYVENYINRNN